MHVGTGSVRAYVHDALHHVVVVALHALEHLPEARALLLDDLLARLFGGGGGCWKRTNWTPLSTACRPGLWGGVGTCRWSLYYTHLPSYARPSSLCRRFVAGASCLLALLGRASLDRPTEPTHTRARPIADALCPVCGCVDTWLGWVRTRWLCGHTHWLDSLGRFSEASHSRRTTKCSRHTLANATSNGHGREASICVFRPP